MAMGSFPQSLDRRVFDFLSLLVSLFDFIMCLCCPLALCDIFHTTVV